MQGLKYSSKQNYEKDILAAGIDLESYLGEALIEHFTQTTKTNKDRARKALSEHYFEGRSRLMALFGEDNLGGELLVGYSDSVITAVNLIDE